MRPRLQLVDELDEDESFDFGRTKERLMLVLRAPLRHPKIAVLVFFAISVIGFLASLRVKPLYRAETDIIVQKNINMPLFGEAARNQQNNDVDPVEAVSQTVKSRDNLIALVNETHLADRTDLGSTSLSQDEKVRRLAKMLESKLTVKTEGVIVSFVVDWGDPQVAYDLVSAAVHNFLDSRNAAEVSIISSAITLLEEHAKGEREGIDAAMEEFLHLKQQWKSPSSGGVVVSTRGGQSRVVIDPDVAKHVEEKKQQIKDLQDERRKQMGELRGQMAGLLGTYTPSHPAVAALQRKIDALSEEPSSLAALKNEERGLLNQLAASAGGKAPAGPATSGAASGAMSGPGASDTGRSPASAGILSGAGRGPSSQPSSRQDLEIADPASAMALSKFQNRVHKYEEFMDQISAAKLQLDLARNAFQFRYGIQKPAEVPTRPRYPLGAIVIAVAVALGLLLAMGVTAVVDLMSGRFVESWQVKQRLSLPLLGEVTRQ